MFSKIEHLSKVTTSTFTLDFTGIGGLLIVSCGSNLCSLLQELSCKVIFQPVGEI